MPESETIRADKIEKIKDGQDGIKQDHLVIGSWGAISLQSGLHGQGHGFDWDFNIGVKDIRLQLKSDKIHEERWSDCLGPGK